MAKYGIQETQTSSKGLQTALVLGCMAALVLVAMTAATQVAASAYGYQAGLGTPLFTAGVPWYWPWAIFVWQPHLDAATLDKATTVGQLTIIVPLIIAGAAVMARKPKGNATLHGSAHWATKKEIEKLGYFGGQGVYIGGYWDKPKGRQLYLRHNGPEHLLCFAPTRSGKGVGLILPTLLSWPGSSLTLDIKGENWALTSGWRKEQGHTVLRFDPADPSGAGCRFNPLAEVQLDSLEAIQDVQNIALMLVDPDGKGLDDHWTKAAFAFFSGLILHCCLKIPFEDLQLQHEDKKREPRFATLADLTLMMADEARDTEELLQEMLETDHASDHKELFPDATAEIGRAIHTFIASSAREMLSKEEKERSGVLSSALVNMALYRDPIVGINTAGSDFRIHDLMNQEKPTDLYLVVSPAHIDRLRPLLRLIVDLIIRRTCAKMEFQDGTSKASYKHRMLLMLDEFTSLGKLPIVEKAIAYIAGYGGKMYIIVQDIKQLNGVYGKDNAIMANCHVRIAYAPNDPETADVLSKMSGQTTVVEKKVSISSGRGGGSRSTNIAETARPLLTADECMRLPGAEKDAAGKVKKAGHMLIFTAGQSPIYGMQILYFLDPTFSQRAKIVAPGVCEKFPAGITDSFYDTARLEALRKDTPADHQEPAAEQSMPTKTFEDFLQKEDA